LCPEASSAIAEVIGSGGGSFAIAGFAGVAACLATAIDAFHRGHTVTYLTDASASHALDDIVANDVHRVVSGIVGLYGDAITTRSWIARTSRKSSWKGLGDGTEHGRTA